MHRPLPGGWSWPPAVRPPTAFLALAAALLMLSLSGLEALAHAVAAGDKGYIQEITGVHLIPFVYLGAKHMVTGYDHLLFLVGVIFFLYRLRHVALYVSLFALGHSITLLAGVLWNWQVNAYVIDAIIGLSVAYKAFDNLNGFRTLFGMEPPPRLAVLVFGLFHGMGLATKLQELNLSANGLITNLVSFNVGVEIGQFLALGGILIAMNIWRRSASFLRHAYATNAALMTAGFLLAGFQISSYLLAS
jgi:hypothetical protein